MRLDNRPFSRPELSLLFAAAGTLLPFGFMFLSSLLAGLGNSVDLTILVVNPALLIAGIVFGIKERRSLLGLVGLIWSVLALILFLAAVLFPVFAKAHEHG